MRPSGPLRDDGGARFTLTSGAGSPVSQRNVLVLLLSKIWQQLAPPADHLKKFTPARLVAH
jgi:hypothetical protein